MYLSNFTQTMIKRRQRINKMKQRKEAERNIQVKRFHNIVPPARGRQKDVFRF